MPKVAITTEPLFRAPGPHLEVLHSAGFELIYPHRPELPTEADTAQGLADADAVLAGGDVYSAWALDRLPKLKVISRMGVGYDRVDVDAATSRGIAVTITPNANHEGVAEHALALMLAIAREIVENDRQVRAGRWLKPRLVPLRGKTLGLIGIGRIGRSLASRAAALRMKVIAHDPYANVEMVRALNVQLVTLDQLLDQSDFVSLHAPLLPQTRGLMNRQAFERMKPGSFLVNTARGGLVIEEDLIEALQSGRLAGAALDVLGVEPPPADHPLLSNPRVIVTSHIAGSDAQAVHDMAVGAAQNIVDLYQGHWPEECLVNPAVRSSWSWRSQR